MFFKNTLRKIAALVLQTEISLTIVYVVICLSFLCFSIHFVRTLRNYDGDGNGNIKKVIGLISKTTITLFLYISLQSLHNYDVK